MMAHAVVRRCGGTTCPPGTCDHDPLRRSATGSGPATAPQIVHDVLASPGLPLDAGARAYFEPRLGHDFGHVRVHTDATADASAAAVGARAYTVGSHVAFAAGTYQPAAAEGRRLIAHELTHTIQQHGRAEPTTALFALDVGAVDDPTEREANHVADAVMTGPTPPVHASSPSTTVVRRACPTPPTGIASKPLTPFPCDSRGPDVVAGDVVLSCQDSTDLIDGQNTWVDDITDRARAATLIEIHGNASTEGPSADYNRTLACMRARAFRDLLVGRGVTTPTQLISHGPTTQYGPPAANRNVVLVLTMPPPQHDEEKKAPPAPPAKPSHLCGPDVTAELKSAMSGLRASFGGMSSTQRSEMCDTLDSVLKGAAYTWDVVELHNSDWIWQDYRPACATEGAKPACSHSVQVGDQCWYAGSANYVTFGTMCSLCSGHYAGASNAARFTESNMLDLIDKWKGKGYTGLATPAPNFKESQLWASYGYKGWPATGNPTGGDRNNCSPTCPTPFTHPHFKVRWCPHLDPYSTC